MMKNVICHCVRMWRVLANPVTYITFLLMVMMTINDHKQSYMSLSIGKTTALSITISSSTLWYKWLCSTPQVQPVFAPTAKVFTCVKANVAISKLVV